MYKNHNSKDFQVGKIFLEITRNNYKVMLSLMSNGQEDSANIKD